MGNNDKARARKFGTFVTEIPLDDPKAMEEFQKAMDAHYDECDKYVKDLASQLQVSEECASDIFYLRGRSSHTPELEVKLILLHKKGTPPNIFEFGN